MKLKVIVEEVENLNQLRFLMDNECDCIQSFLISEPVPATQTELLIGKTLLEVYET